MIDKRYKALRLILAKKGIHYKQQASYIEHAIAVGRINIKNAIKYNEEAKTLRRVASDIDNILYPID